MSPTETRIWKEPNEIYDQIPAYIETFDADDRDMTKYIIGTVSDMDTPMNPNTKGTVPWQLIYKALR